ncbi:hypothetical protein HNY73_004589 [Argiope bruennichi]|uniref:Uncharacterized protein n=1 Tax=Argiope bruennichi TaxID=94029 RepID=A0A8T0FU54_ARGBR|nr:hypothetical protein HNY73_004589 [Argiope bruennichi]
MRKELNDKIQTQVESQVKGIKDHVNSCVEKIEEDVPSVEREIGIVKDEARTNVEAVQKRIGNLEKRLSELEDRPNSEFSYTRPTVKPLTFDGQTSWTVFKTQFDVVSSTNGWTDVVKASQLVASLRGSAAEVLQGIPSEKLTDLMTIEEALESRFGDSHLTQFYRTQLKTRRQKAGESLQVLAADVQRLMSLAYAECRRDVRESLAVQYFVDAIRDEDTQLATRLTDEKDLKSALAYSMKYAVTDFPSQVSQKGVLVAASLVDLKTEAIPVRVLNLNNRPKIVSKGTVIASCDPVVDIVARPQEFSGAHPPIILENLEGLDEQQKREKYFTLTWKRGVMLTPLPTPIDIPLVNGEEKC